VLVILSTTPILHFMRSKYCLPTWKVLPGHNSTAPTKMAPQFVQLRTYRLFFQCRTPPVSAVVEGKICCGVLHKSPSINSSTGLYSFTFAYWFCSTRQKWKYNKWKTTSLLKVPSHEFWEIGAMCRWKGLWKPYYRVPFSIFQMRLHFFIQTIDLPASLQRSGGFAVKWQVARTNFAPHWRLYMQHLSAV